MPQDVKDLDANGQVVEDDSKSEEAPKEEAPKETPKDEKPEDGNDEVKKLRREAAGYRTERNTLRTENEQLKTQLAELKEGNDGASARVTDLERENARLSVALEKGIPKSLVGRLQGNTPEELAADADELLAMLGPARQGFTDGGVRPPVSPPDIRTQIAEAEAAGNWSLSRQLKSQLVHKQATEMKEK